MKPWVVALVGNPNSGKSTLFNALTGNRQEVGNWCGVTVEKKRGWFQVHDQSIEIIDLPGCYDVVADPTTSLDEQITTQYLATAEADVVISVIDATNLERHLFLTLQLLESGHKVVVALNMMDAAKKQNILVDVPLLATNLGCPVIEVVAVTGSGIPELKMAIQEQCLNPRVSIPASVLNINANETDTTPKQSFDIATAKAHFDRIESIIQATVLRPPTMMEFSCTERIDSVVLNRYFGIPIFLLVMYGVFMFAIQLSAVFQDFFDIASRAIFMEAPERILTNYHFPKWFIQLVSNGIGQGINTSVSFIPVLAGMFLSLSFIEASGYMARAAFVMDKVMQWVGLPGKSFVPMIIGFGCNVPAVMASRTLENYRERVLTILMSPFMSCGARLAIYALFVAAFFPTGGQNIIFGLYLIGICVALFSGFLLRTTVLSGESSALIIELPPYRWPSLKSIWKTTYLRLKRFMVKAGLLIIALCVLIGTWSSIRSNTGMNDGLASFGRLMTPIFAPMGIEEDNWPATVGLFTGILAKEVVVGTLNALYVQDEIQKSDVVESVSIQQQLKQALQSIPDNALRFGQLFGVTIFADMVKVKMPSDKVGVMVEKFGSRSAAFAYLLFLLLYFPCVSVVAAISKELNSRWAIFSVVWTTGIAYTTAVLFYQAATLVAHPQSSLLWIAGLLGTLVSCFQILRKRVKQKTSARRSLPTQILILD